MRYLTAINSKLLLLIICSCIHLKTSSQDLKYLYYGNDRIPASDLFLLDDGYKLITTVGDENHKTSTVLLNEGNFLVDTLDDNLGAYKYHVLTNDKIVVEGKTTRQILSVLNNKITIENDGEVDSGLQRGYFSIYFNDKLVDFLEGKVDVISRSSQGNFSPESKRKTLIPQGRKAKINRKLIKQLPVVYGLSETILSAFIRDTQTLYTIDSDWAVKRFELPVDKSFVWSYFYDRFEQEHYLIKIMKDKLELFSIDIESGKYKELNEISKFPTAIIHYNLLVCEGSRIKNCDYYLYPIFPEDERKDSELLKPIEVQD